MIKRFLFLIGFSLTLCAMEQPAAYVIGIVNESGRTLQIQLRGAKGILVDRNFSPSDGMEKTISKDESWVELRVYENGRLEFADRADLKEMRLHYFDVAKKESGFGFIIENVGGRIAVKRDRNFFGSSQKPVKLVPIAKPAAAKPAAVPVTLKPTAKPAPAMPAAKAYQIRIRNLESIPVRVELIAARDGKALQGATLVNEQIERNGESSYSFDAKDFPLTLRVYQFTAGKEEMVLEDEVDLPKLGLSQFEFAVYRDLESNPILRFNPNVPHGQGVKTKKSMQPKQVVPAASASAAPVQKPSATVLQTPVFKNYEVRLENGSQLPLRFKLITVTGRILFDSTLSGTPTTASQRTGTQFYSVVPSDFPLKVYSYDDSGMSGNFDWTFSLDQARTNAAETRTSLAGSRSVQFGQENQFVIWVRDSRPTRTGTTHTVAGIDAYSK